MTGSGIKKLAADLGLTVKGGAAFGELKGCFVAFMEGGGYKQMSLYIGCGQAAPISADGSDSTAFAPEALQAQQYIREKVQQDNQYRILPDRPALHVYGLQLAHGGDVLQIRFQDTIGAMKRIRAFIDEVLPGVAALTRPRRCALCGQELDSTAVPGFIDEEGGMVLPMHAHCLDTQAAQALREEQEQAPSPLLLPILGALVGALIGAALWAVVGALGYVAGFVGFVIAWLAAKGWQLMGGKPGPAMTVTLIVCVVLAVLAGNAGTIAYQLHTAYQEAAADLNPWETIVPENEYFRKVIPMLLEDQDVRGDLIRDFLIGLFFAALGSFGTIIQAGKKQRGQTPAKRIDSRL